MIKDTPYINDLSSYIKKNLKKGYTKEALKWALVDQGHSKLEIDKAFSRAEKELASEAPILKTKPKITREIIEPKTDTPIQSGQQSNKQSFWKKWFG